MALAAAIVVRRSAELSHGVDVVGHVPQRAPGPRLAGHRVDDWLALLPTAFGILILSTEAVGVARALAQRSTTTRSTPAAT